MTAAAELPRPRRRLARDQGELRFVTARELMAELGIRDRATVRSWVERGRLPPPEPGHFNGSRHLWDWAKCQRYLHGDKRRPRVAAQPSDEARITAATRARIGATR